MLISHKLKLIFIHIPKNAGTFIWQLLKKYDNDLCEIWNYESSRRTLHNKSTSIKDKCDFDYTKYLIFCVIRNPIDRLVSLYSYIKNNDDYPTHSIVVNLSFEQFIEYKFSQKDFLETNYINQYQFIYDNANNLLVNKIIRYENLKNEIKLLLLERNININDIEFTRVNSSDRVKTKIPHIRYITKHIPDIKNDMLLFKYTT